MNSKNPLLFLLLRQAGFSLSTFIPPALKLRRAGFLLSAFLFILLSFGLLADEGDTLVIQTIDWDTPVLPGWNSPRSGFYEFPGDTTTFSKILMYYTLKCDPGQNPACGEWDYTTHTRLQEHTGVYDSNLYHHPNYMVNNASPDSFMFMNDESFYYNSWLEYSNQTTPENEATVGAGGESLIFHNDNVAPDGKLQHIYRAAEMTAGSLQSGDITGIKYNFGAADISFKHFKVRIKHIDSDTLPPNRVINDGFTTVFDKNMTFAEGISVINFAFPFNWDGSSNILIDLSWSEKDGSAALEADQVSTKASKYNVAHDYFLDFEGWDYVNVPAEVFSTIDSTITISFWQYGNPTVQPINSSIFEGVDSAGHRVLNAHLPWSNGRIYWDAGWDNGNDRLELPAGDPSDYEGQWNHWAFTKDVESGAMLVFLNGELFNIGGGKYRLMDGIAEFRIGAAITYDGYYAGMIDEVRIWDKVVDQETIKAYMYKDVTPDHPYYNNLRGYYRFNAGNGFTVDDSSPHDYDGYQFGYPEWMNYRGEDRFRNAVGFDVRAHVIFESGSYDPMLLDSVVMVDTFSKAPVNIVLFDPDDPPMPMDTLTKWPSYYNNYVYDEGGKTIDSTLVTPDSTIYYEDLPYYGDPYEIVIPWEIARYITPYGIGLDLGEGWTWVFDVTDYEPMLRDSVHITAGNFQELLDLKFYMIEGTPPRDVKKIEKVYSGYWNLSEFPEKVPPKTLQLIDEASTFKVKTRTSGHRFDNPTNCAEFCYKVHNVEVNGESIYDWQIIEECSNNPLYPQGGTWIYDRAGWCPGAKVTEHDIEITPYITSDSVVLDYNSQPDPYGAYVLEVQLFSYGDPNFDTDAAVDGVIAPNNMEVYGRFNPTTSSPMVVIQNRGGDSLYKVDITYGPQGSSKTYTWTGALGLMQKEDVSLEPFTHTELTEGDGKFLVSLSNPNNTADENTINDTFESSYDMPPVYPGTIIIKFKTNKAAYQNQYQIFDHEGNLVFERGDFENNTTYTDTITFVNGAFDFYLWDSGDNGISFWANSEGSGSLRFYDINDDLIKSFNGDFGDRIYHSFYMDMYLGKEDVSSGNLAFDVLPNPTDGKFILSYALKATANIQFSIYNSSGQAIWEKRSEGQFHGKVYVDLGNAAPGLYTCVMKTRKDFLSKKIVLK